MTTQPSMSHQRSRRSAVAAAGLATTVLLAPALYGVFSSAGGNGVPAIPALIAAGLAASALGVVGAVTAASWMSVGHRPWSVVGVLVGALLLWWTLVIAAPVLGVIYTNIGSPTPEDCQDIPPGSACL